MGLEAPKRVLEGEGLKAGDMEVEAIPGIIPMALEGGLVDGPAFFLAWRAACSLISSAAALAAPMSIAGGKGAGVEEEKEALDCWCPVVKGMAALGGTAIG